MNTFADTRAVIIGGSQGMGFEAARQLIQEGGKVLLTGTTEANLAAAKAELGERAHVVRSNAATLGEIRHLAAEVESHFGRIDTLLLFAGTCEIEPFEQVSERSYDRQFDLNTRGMFFTTQQLSPLIRDGGSIVFVTSVANRSGTPGMSVYSATKAALWSLTQVLAAELLPRHIRVNAVSPGFIDTPTMGVSASPEERRAFAREGAVLTPLGRIGSPGEVAAAVLFMACHATFSTATELVVDGGIAQGITPTHSAPEETA